MPKIQPRQKLRRLALEHVIPPALPGRGRFRARLRMVIYRLHNAYCFSKFQSKLAAVQEIVRFTELDGFFPIPAPGANPGTIGIRQAAPGMGSAGRNNP